VMAPPEPTPAESVADPAQEERFAEARGFVAVGEVSTPFGEVDSTVKKKTKRCMKCVIYFYPRQQMVLVYSTILKAFRHGMRPPQEHFVKRNEWYSNQMKDTAARSQGITQRDPKSIEATNPSSLSPDGGGVRPPVELNLDGFPQPTGDPVELISIVACLNERSPTIIEAIVNAALGGFGTFALCSDLHLVRPAPNSSYPVYDPLQQTPATD